MSNQQRLFKLISALAILAMLFSSLQSTSVYAKGGDGIQRQVNAESGKVSFIGPKSGSALPAFQALNTFLRPQNPAMALAKRFASEFGVGNPERDLAVMKNNRSEDGRLTVRYQQKYQDIPVIGGDLIVNTNDSGDLYSMNGEASADLSLSTKPTIDSAQARDTALQNVAKWYQGTPGDFIATEPELWIYDESLLSPSTRPVELVWRMEVSAKDNATPVRELILVNAQRGEISLHFNQIDTEWKTSRDVRDITNDHTGSAQNETDSTNLMPANSGLQSIKTYTANNTYYLPGTLLCDQSNPTCTNGANPHADKAHLYAIGTYNLYLSKHNRNGIDQNNLPIISTVHYNSNYANAFWNGLQMVYGDGYGFPLADDVVAHELTHGVTQYASNLFYFYQSGAINESFSDLWGEYYDQTNGQGNDNASVKWLSGEDIYGMGALRSMSNPPLFSNPDKMSSPYYETTPSYSAYWDNGGVHTNSGVNNKAVYLMVDGDTFNGRTVTGIGWDKTAAIYYEANTNLLTSGADYSDLYYALQQACTNLVGGSKGITAADCVQVKNAIDAVEMNGQPVANYNTDTPLCSDGSSPRITFADDLENGLGNWTFQNGTSSRWQFDSLYGPYAQSGSHSLYANDYPAAITDAKAQLTSLVIPSNAYLYFAQAYEFEFDAYGTYDGGVMEYSNNGGVTWVDAGSLMDYNGYTGTLYSNGNNPLKGRFAFVASSHGYISTRLNLTPLAGQTINFRWRMGLDSSFYASGWWVDNVRLYTCSRTISGNAGVGGAILTYTDGGPQAVMADGGGNYSIAVPFGWSGTIVPHKIGYSFTPPNRGYSNVQSNQTAQDYAASVCLTCADKETVGVFRPSNGLLYLKNFNSTGFADIALNYGLPGDYPVVGDWDGDGDATIGIYRNGSFYLRNSNTIGFADVVFPFGMPGDQPIAGDWDGDGDDTVGVYRNGTFFLRNDNSSGVPEMIFALGVPGDIGIAGDWNGDELDTTGVFRPSNGALYLKNTNATGFADIQINYGLPGDKPVTGDWDNNGIDTIGIYRDGAFYLRNSNTIGFADWVFALGIPGDHPIAGNCDGLP